MDGKVFVIFNRNCFPKMKDFSRLVALNRKSGSIKEMAHDGHTVTTQPVRIIIWPIYLCYFQQGLKNSEILKHMHV